MDDLTSLFYQHLASGRKNIPDPVKLPPTGTLAKFEDVLNQVDSMSDGQCRLMLVEVLNLLLSQQRLLEEVMKPKL